MNKALVLSFNLNERAQLLLEGLCAALDIEARAVPPASFGVPLGRLVGMPAAGFAAKLTLNPFADPMLVMCGLDQDRFNAFLQSLRFSGIPRIDLKAVLTPTNVAWTPAQLRDELAREHARMHG